MKLIIYFLVAVLAFIILRHVQPQGIMFYQGVVVGLIAFAIHGLVGKDWKDAMLVFLAFYAFVFTIPVTVDRSYSVRMLDRIATSEDGLSREDIGHMFEKYFETGGGADRRIAEQKATRSITEEDGRIVATPIGRMLDASFRATTMIFASDIEK